MERLRPRHREVHIGFTKAETQKMERLLRELGEQVLERQFCQNIAKCFNRSAGRAGKPIVKWTEVQSWLQNRAQELPNTSKNISEQQGIHPSNKALGSSEIPKEEKTGNISELEFEARSSKDGAWYDVESFLAHRSLGLGETICWIWSRRRRMGQCKKSSARTLCTTGAFRMSIFEGWRPCPLLPGEERSSNLL